MVAHFAFARRGSAVAPSRFQQKLVYLTESPRRTNAGSARPLPSGELAIGTVVWRFWRPQQGSAAVSAAVRRASSPAASAHLACRYRARSAGSNGHTPKTAGNPLASVAHRCGTPHFEPGGVSKLSASDCNEPLLPARRSASPGLRARAQTRAARRFHRPGAGFQTRD
jgi:hypothetical protein